MSGFSKQPSIKIPIHKRRFIKANSLKKDDIIRTSETDLLTSEYIATVLQESYIGKKGYTIPKSVLSKEDLAFLYKDLFLKPEIFNPMVKTPEDESFPVYRENANKIYIPRFYGINRYGLPEKSELSGGESISVPFENNLRDYQDKIIGVYMNHVITKGDKLGDKLGDNLGDKHITGGGGGILEVPCGRGKTVMALKIISLLKTKTLIKEILVPASGKSTMFGGAWCIVFVTSENGNFVLKGYMKECEEYIKRKHK